MMRLFKLLAFAAVLLSLAGCYRPAGDAVPPTAVEPLVTPTPEAAMESDESTSTPATDAQSAGESTLPPITVIAPQSSQTRPTVSLGMSADSLTQTAESAPTQSGEAGTPQFITPESPSLVTIVFPSSTPVNGTPSATPSGLITPTALGTGTDECTYVVQAGEGLFRIALNNDFTLEEMRAANPDLVGDNPILQPGQVLNLPNCESTSASPATEPTQAPVVEPPASGGDTTTYVVQSGDTLFTIAQQFGITVQDIVNANTLTNPDRLDVGQTLIIPQSG